MGGIGNKYPLFPVFPILFAKTRRFHLRMMKNGQTIKLSGQKKLTKTARKGIILKVMEGVVRNSALRLAVLAVCVIMIVACGAPTPTPTSGYVEPSGSVLPGLSVTTVSANSIQGWSNGGTFQSKGMEITVSISGNSLRVEPVKRPSAIWDAVVVEPEKTVGAFKIRAPGSDVERIVNVQVGDAFRIDGGVSFYVKLSTTGWQVAPVK